MLGSKKWVPNWRSVRSMVTAPAMTGRAMISRIDWVSIVQTKSGTRLQVIPGARMLAIVTKMLSAPMKDEIPVRWMRKIQASTPLVGE